MSAAETRDVINGLVKKHNDLGPEDFTAYSFIAFGILAHHAPELLTFILDRADEQIGEL